MHSLSVESLYLARLGGVVKSLVDVHVLSGDYSFKKLKSTISYWSVSLRDYVWLHSEHVIVVSVV